VGGVRYQVSPGGQVLDDLEVESTKVEDLRPSPGLSDGLFESLVAGADGEYLASVDNRCGGIELVLAAVTAAMGGAHVRVQATDEP
jgi:hypothetical protein